MRGTALEQWAARPACFFDPAALDPLLLEPGIGDTTHPLPAKVADAMAAYAKGLGTLDGYEGCVLGLLGLGDGGVRIQQGWGFGGSEFSARKP